MGDGSQQGPQTNAEMGADEGEDALRAWFAQHLVDEPLPTAVLDRVTLRVLDEVRSGLAESTIPVVGRATGPGSVGGRLAAAFERTRRWLRSLTPNQSLLLAGAGALVALLLIVVVSRITPRPLSITAEVSGGDATVLNWHSDRFRVQGDGDLIKLRQGDQILTGEGSVRLSHLANQVSIIEPGAHVELTRIDEADGGRQLALKVHDGAVLSQLNSPLQPQDLYIVSTRGITASAVGTDFVVEAVSEDETLVTARSGRVHVTMGKQTVTVGPGEEVDAILGRDLAVQAADGKYDGGLLPRLVTLAAADGLQLYAQPRLDSAPLGRVPAGRSLTIQAEDPTGAWLKVCCVAGKPGWVTLP
jgi:hypothetical protein